MYLTKLIPTKPFPIVTDYQIIFCSISFNTEQVLLKP